MRHVGGMLHYLWMSLSIVSVHPLVLTACRLPFRSTLSMDGTQYHPGKDGIGNVVMMGAYLIWFSANAYGLFRGGRWGWLFAIISDRRPLAAAHIRCLFILSLHIREGTRIFENSACDLPRGSTSRVEGAFPWCNRSEYGYWWRSLSASNQVRKSDLDLKGTATDSPYSPRRRSHFDNAGSEWYSESVGIGWGEYWGKGEDESWKICFISAEIFA